MAKVSTSFGRFIQSSKRKHKLRMEEMDEDDKVFFPRSIERYEEVFASIQVVADRLSRAKDKKSSERTARKRRGHLKVFWDDGYVKWDEQEFKEQLHISRTTFEFILEKITPVIIKIPTRMIPSPIEPHRQLALTLYRLGHGCIFRNISDLFGVSVPLAVATFNKVVRVMIDKMYDNHVVSMPNDGLDQKCNDLAASAQWRTQDGSLLRCSMAYKDISVNTIPDQMVDTAEGENSLVIFDDPSFARLLEMYNKNTKDPQKSDHNKELHSTNVVAESSYDMMKSRFRILNKRCESKLQNGKFIVIVCAMLHSVCIAKDDSCSPSWKLQVDEVD